MGIATTCLYALIVFIILDFVMCVREESVLVKNRDKISQSKGIIQDNLLSKNRIDVNNHDHVDDDEPLKTSRKVSSIVNTAEPLRGFRDDSIRQSIEKFEQFDLPVIPNTFNPNDNLEVAKKFSGRYTAKGVSYKHKGTDLLEEENSMFKVIWDLLHYGHLPEPVESYTTASFQDSSNSFKSEMSNGIGLVVASCQVTIAYASSSPNNTVLSTFFDEKSALKCEDRILEKRLSNVLSFVTDVDQVIDTYLHSNNVNFDFIFIQDFDRLTDGLLPQEIEAVGEKMLTISSSILLSLNVDSGGKRFKFFESSWNDPGTLINNICGRVTDGNCTSKMIKGSVRYWTPFVVALMVEKEKYASKVTKVCESRGLPLELLLSYNMTTNCRNKLFLSVLTSNIEWLQKSQLFIHGHKVVAPTCSGNEFPAPKIDELKSAPSSIKKDINVGVAQNSAAKILRHNIFKNKGTNQEKQSEFSGVTTNLNVATSLSNKFDIVDGRPLEEEKMLTEGYQYLGQNEHKSTPVVKNKIENSYVEIYAAKQIEPARSMKKIPNLQRNNILEGNLGSKNMRKQFRRKEIKEQIEKDKSTDSVKLSRNDRLPTQSLIHPGTSRFGMRKLQFFSRDDAKVQAPHLSEYAKSMYNKLGTQEQQHFRRKYSPFGDYSWGRKTTERNVNTVSTQKTIHRKSLTDENRYELLKKMLAPYLRDIFKTRKTVSGLVSGGCYISMLSAKLSLQHPNATIVTLDTDTRHACNKKFGSILDSSEISNNFMIRDVLSPDMLYQISHIPQLFDFQVVGVDIFSWLLQMGSAFPDYLGRILTMSKVSFIEVPNWQHVKAANQIFQTNPNITTKALDSFQVLLSASLSSTKAQLLKVTEVSNTTGSRIEKRNIFMVELQSFKKKVYTTCTNDNTSPATLSYSNPTVTLSADDKQQDSQTFCWSGLNLKFLLSLNLELDHRKKLFQSYVRLPLHIDMCPCRLIWSHGKLSHVDDPLSQNPELSLLQQLTKLVSSEIHPNVFSFMDYNSPDRYIGTQLAHKHPHSTFILCEDSLSAAESKTKETERDGLNNSVVLHLPVTKDFSEHLLKSPDILRYQFIDLVSLILTSSKLNGKDTFRTIMGQLLAAGMTNFISVPSSEILSLASTTIFPGLFDVDSQLISNTNPFFENAAEDLLLQAVETNKLNIRLHNTPHPPLQSTLPSSKLIRSSWRLNTVRILHLQLQVDHHFQFEIDQHQRKYIQHVERKGSSDQPVVFLTREEDDYQINYGNVSAISLIALLRMGLLPSTREKFYTLFLQLPLHEDMAPWNIVFQGGKLAYIDQDTRDITYDKFVPMAYQILSVLINYERTVNDFKHCGETAKTQFNFGHVSSCVSSKFQGPCPDSKFPVPCGDSSCQPTYIHCLRALQANMKNVKDHILPPRRMDAQHCKKGKGKERVLTRKQNGYSLIDPQINE